MRMWQRLCTTALVGYVLLLSLMLTTTGVSAATQDLYKNARLSQRIVQTRYGRLQGLVLPLDQFKFLRPVEAFLGVPYATPPTLSNRFSPTRAPSPWDGVRPSDKFSPVCPQRLPNIANETAALERMPKGRLEYLRRLLPYLQDQSEDCLYLNVFAPVHATTSVEKKLPVIVFLHGESFEWNGGNPYDGTVLASYGELVVVTLNYRLGILGFLNANPSPHLRARVANYGLMDQMAALHWVQQNIAKFGGDPEMVTLAGHGSGAACINFLMTSPTMVPGLFHRAILLSGSSYSSWAIVENPVVYAIKLAREVNCTIPDDLNANHEQIVDCLRDVSLEDLYAADIQAPSYLTAFGPSVDGVVIRRGLASQEENEDDDDTSRGPSSRSTDASGRYDLLFGVVTGEALWRFSASDIQSGFEGERRDRIIRTYVRNAYTYHLSEIFYTVVNEYTDWERTSQHPINTRDAAVSALSDAQFVAPLVHTGDTLAPLPAMPGQERTGPKCFFYVFDYQTKDGDYPQRMGTVHGEDLPYVFGAPLVEGFSHFPRNYTKSEVALSEALMVFWSNFARTGNPNEHHRQDQVLVASKERNRYRSIVWDEYDPVHQKYLEIGMKPRMKNHFRAHQLSIWLRLIPELHRAGMEDVIARHNLFKNHEDLELYVGPVKPDSLQRLTVFADAENHLKRRGNSSITTVEPASLTTCIPLGNYTASHHTTGGHSSDGGSGATSAAAFAPGTMVLHPSGGGDGTGSGGGELALIETESGSGYSFYSTALSVTIAIGCSLLILNVLIFAGVYYQRDKTRMEVKSLQKQYQQRSGGGSLAGGVHHAGGGVGGGGQFDAIKHGHYHLGQNNSVIVDVESQLVDGSGGVGGGGGGDMKSAAHICANTMQLSASTAVPIASKPPVNEHSGGGGGGAMLAGSGGGSATNKQQQQQQQHSSSATIKTFNRSSSTYNPSMMTLPKHVGGSGAAGGAGVHHQINYNRTTDCMTLPRNITGTGTTINGSSGVGVVTGNADTQFKPINGGVPGSKIPPRPPVRASSPPELQPLLAIQQQHHQPHNQQQQSLQHHQQQHHQHNHQQHYQQQQQAPPQQHHQQPPTQHHPQQPHNPPDAYHMQTLKGGGSAQLSQVPQAAMTEMRV